MPGPNLVLPLPDILSDVEDSAITVSASDVQMLFDQQVIWLLGLINAQLYDFELLSDRERKFDCIVLSMGPGSSPYIQSKVQVDYYDSLR
jgi:hypothetical protein